MTDKTIEAIVSGRSKDCKDGSTVGQGKIVKRNAFADGKEALKWSGPASRNQE